MVPPIASHLPVLIALALRSRFSTVVEFGAGFYSTRAFLRRRLFPDVERLVSYEPSPRYVVAVRDMCGPDPRLVFGERGGAEREVRDADLVLVDNDPWEERVAVMAAVRAAAPACVVVLHDAESHLYADAIRAFPHAALYTPFLGCPSTSLVSVAPLVSLPDELIARACHLLATEAWPPPDARPPA